MTLLRCRAPLAAALAVTALSGVLLPGGQYSVRADEAAPPSPPPAMPAATPVATAAPQAPEAAPTPAPTPRIEPHARALIDRMMAVYKGLKSYSGTMDLTAVAPPGETAPPAQHTTIVLQKPNRVSLKITGKDNAVTIVSNGTNLFAMTTGDKAHYLKRPLPTGAMAPGVMDFLSMSGVDKSGLGRLLGGLDPTPNPRFMKSLSVAKDENVGGVPVDVVTADFEVGPVQGAVVFMIGKDDHLLRKIVVTQTAGGKMGSITETHGDIKIDSVLPANAFAFIPPKGAKPVTPPVGPEAASGEPPVLDPRLKPGVVPPAFSARDIMGKPINLSLFKGRVVLLDFWATWCGPCRAELPMLVNAYKKFNKQGFTILSISFDQPGERKNLIEFARKNQMTWRHIYDEKQFEGQIARLYKVQAAGVNLLIGRDGKIAAVNAHGAELAPAISKALAKK